MPIYKVHLTTPIHATFRAEQVAGMFDRSLDELAREHCGHTLTAELPGLDEDWTIGAIVGPSGSGKTTLARAAWGDAIYQPSPWPEDVPLIEALEGKCESLRVRRCESAKDHEPASLSRSHTLTPSYSLKHLVRALTAVGLASPPSWLKPYSLLSTGERFRADLARALLVPSPSLLVFDEFTSTLDRTVACTASAALGKYLRKCESAGVREGESNKDLDAASPTLTLPHSHALTPRFVALSCHTDFLPWLAPDWMLDLARDPPRLSRGCPEQPELPLAVRRVPQSLWPRFAPHHYLSGSLSRAATCYAALVARDAVGGMPSRSDGIHPIAFCAVVAALGWRRTKRITRLVVLPEFQGLGIGPRLAEAVAAIEAAKGNRVTITASHPAIVGHCSRSPRWRYAGLKKTGSTRQQLGGRPIRSSGGRAVASFEFITPSEPGTLAISARANEGHERSSKHEPCQSTLNRFTATTYDDHERAGHAQKQREA
jgi:GNAT superfamily N-acetyltransferase/ABC-type uncharacterized transport system YnjBCD ATPase subunit